MPILSEGTTVKIVYSRKLQDYGLVTLSGQTGTITQCLFKNRRNPGAYVLITKGRNKGEEWFIPIRSLQTKEILNRMRSAIILRDIIG